MDATCVNHSAAPAVARCMNCQKHLCDQCVHYYQSSVYCSPECAKASEEKGKELHKKLEVARNKTGFFAGLVKLIILAAVAALVLDYLDIDLPFVPDMF